MIQEGKYEKQSLRALLSNCDKRFYPYIEKVIERLSDKVREEVLSDSQIISLDVKATFGLYMSFDSPIKWLIILNESLLRRPEFEIIHTIVHELAHKVADKGKTALHEMAAEKLLVKWGFEKESKMVSYHRPILETEGFKVGYQWAEKHDLTDFEEFYDEWNEGRLSTKRYKMLLYVADPTSILYQMGCLEESKTISPNDNVEVPEGTIVDDGSLDKGIVEGIMCSLREKRTKGSIAYTGDEEFEFKEQLKRVVMEMRKVFDYSEYSKYRDKLPDFSKAHIEISGLLEDEEGGS